MTHALDFEELAIDLMTEIAQMGEIGNSFVDVEIVRVVDGRLALKVGLGQHRRLAEKRHKIPRLFRCVLLLPCGHTGPAHAVLNDSWFGRELRHETGRAALPDAYS